LLFVFNFIIYVPIVILNYYLIDSQISKLAVMTAIKKNKGNKTTYPNPKPSTEIVVYIVYIIIIAEF